MVWESINNRKQNRRQWSDDPEIVIAKDGILLNEAFVVLFDIQKNLNIVVDRQNQRIGFFHPRHDLDRANSYKVSDESRNIRRVNASRAASVFQQYSERPYPAVLNKETGIIEVDFGLSSPAKTSSPV